MSGAVYSIRYAHFDGTAFELAGSGRWLAHQGGLSALRETQPCGARSCTRSAWVAGNARHGYPFATRRAPVQDQEWLPKCPKGNPSTRLSREGVIRVMACRAATGLHRR